MKKNLIFIILILSQKLFSIDRYVDPFLSAGNGTTLFTTIASAVTASVNGDRILIVAGTYNEPTLTLSKSLTLLSQTAGSIINYNGNIVVAGFPGMKLEILGFNLGIYSISSNAITGGSATNRAKVSIIDSKTTNLTLDQDYYELNCARCVVNVTTTFRFGSFVVSKTNDLNIKDEPNQNLSGRSIIIVNDTILNNLEFRNDDCKMLIVNNRLKNIYVFKWNPNNSITNKIVNNDFINNIIFFIPYHGVPYYNLDVSNNQFLGVVNFYSSSNICSTNDAYWTPGYYDGNPTAVCGTIGTSTTTSLFPNPTTPGFFKWTYNGIDLPCTVPTGSQPLVLTKIIGITGTTVDAGNPNHEYYDIDLTINDRGRLGGPYCISNYNPSINPSNGKAFIFDLEMPTDLFPGQQVDIKAKGYHKN